MVRSLSAVALVLAAGEFVSAVIIWREAYPDAQPWFAELFGVLFLTGLALLRAGRTVRGAAVTGVLCAFELATAPTWQRFSVLDRAFQLPYAGVSLVGLLLAVVVLDTHRRSSRAPSGPAVVLDRR